MTCRRKGEGETEKDIFSKQIAFPELTWFSFQIILVIPWYHLPKLIDKLDPESKTTNDQRNEPCIPASTGAIFTNK